MEEKIYDLEFESFLNAVDDGTKDDFKKFIQINRNYVKVAQKIKTLLKSANKSAVINIKSPELNDLNNKTIIAIDGGEFHEEYKRAIISFSGAFLYKNQKYEEKYMSRFNITTPDYFNLTISILRQSLEFEIALRVLREEYEQSGIKPDLVLFDGTFTFPDEALMKYIDDYDDLKNILNDYQKIYSEYFEFIIKNKIPSVGIIKDSISNKFLNSLTSCIKKDRVKNFELAPFFKSNPQIKNQFLTLVQDNDFTRFSELTFIEHLFQKKSNVRTIYLPVEEKFGIRNKLLYDGLNGNLIGFYARYGDDFCPILFHEIPACFINQLDEITRIISSFSTYSIIEGYPQPLYVAHKRAKMNYGKIFQRMNFLRFRLSDIDKTGATQLFKRKLSFIKRYH